MDTTTKHCWRCDQPRLLTEYCRDGKDSVCKKCRYELNSEWAKENRERLRPKRAEYMRQYRANKAKAAKEKAQEAPTVEESKEPTKD